MVQFNYTISTANITADSKTMNLEKKQTLVL